MTSMVNVGLSSDELKLEPGGTAQLVVSVRNSGSETDRYQIEVEGIDLEWYAIPVPAITVEPGEEKRERIHFKVARNPESKAGAYPIIVRVRSLETGDTGVAQASLIVAPFNLLTIELSPKRGTAGYFTRNVEYEVTVANLGNTELKLQMYANDPEDLCLYEFESERVQLAAGEQTTLLLNVQPGTSPVVGTTRLFGFTVTARAVDNAYVSASTQGQIERKSLLTPATLIAFLLLIGAVFVYIRTQPQKVQIASFSAEPAEVQEGGTVTLRWRVLNASRDGISLRTSNGQVIQEALQPEGALTQPVKADVTYELVAANRLGAERRTVAIDAVPAPKITPPVISSFKVDNVSVIKGTPVQLSWEVRNADKLFLSPPGTELNPLLTTFRDTPLTDTTYVLTAKRNGTNTVATRSIRVKVTERSAAVIDAFDAEPRTIDPGQEVTLTWSIANASSVTISPGVGPVDYKSGSVKVTPEKTTAYKLVATDTNGYSTTRTITVVVRKPAPAPAEPQPETPPTDEVDLEPPGMNTPPSPPANPGR